MLEQAYEDCGDHPRLAAYIAMACASVAHRYTAPDDDEMFNVHQSAIDRAIAFAAEDGVTFQSADNPAPADGTSSSPAFPTS